MTLMSILGCCLGCEWDLGEEEAAYLAGSLFWTILL